MKTIDQYQSKKINQQNLLTNSLIVYLFFSGLLGDYFDYFERVVNPIPFLPAALGMILDLFKLLIISLIILMLIRKQRLKKIKAPFFMLFFLFLISNLTIIFFSSQINTSILFGKYYFVGNNFEFISAINFRRTLVYFLDLMIMSTFGLVIENKELFFKKLSKMFLILFLFNALNSLLQLRSFFGNWGQSAIFFLSGIYGSIPMRLTGLFSSPFALASFLALFECFILSTLKKRKKTGIVLLALILFLHIASLTRSGIFSYFFILIAWRFFSFTDNKKIKIDMVIKYLLTFVVLVTLVLILFESISEISYLSRIFQPLNKQSNFSLSFRIDAPLNNLYNLFFKDTLFVFTGLGNDTHLLSDNNFAVLIYKYGVFFFIAYCYIYTKFLLFHKKHFFKLVFLVWLMSNLLYSGAGQFNNMIFLIILSISAYSEN